MPSAQIIFHATRADAVLLRDWLNAEPDVAWIVKVSESDRRYRWQARHSVDTLEVGTHSIWHPLSGPLNIPSGARGIPDATVADPFLGWEQTLDHDGATRPWFGGNLPGPYELRFVVAGREHPNSLARSGFFWLANHFRMTGKAAHPAATKWWNRLRRFIVSHSRAVPWPDDTSRSGKAYLLSDAQREIDAGRPRDINPS